MDKIIGTFFLLTFGLKEFLSALKKELFGQ